jgi:predicted nucleotidyltransferase
LIIRALEVQTTALEEPVDLELDARVDQVVEVAVHVAEREGVWVDKLVADEEVDLWREIHEGEPTGCGLVILRG